jgi:hypothetical protein
MVCSWSCIFIAFFNSILCIKSIQLLVLIFICCGFSSVSYSTNDYRQFERYRKEISKYVMGMEYYNGATQCEKAGIETAWVCQKEVFSKSVSSFPVNNSFPQWQKSVSYSERSCQYSIEQVSTSSVSTGILLKIHQHNCKDNFPFQGGSSFYILSEGFFQLTCNVEDHFNNYYDIYCPFVPHYLSIHQLRRDSSFFPGLSPTLGIQHYQYNGIFLQRYIRETLLGCMLITVMLDYEHYDAFSEIGNHPKQFTRFRPLNITLMSQVRFCSMVNSSNAVEPLHHGGSSLSTEAHIHQKHQHQHRTDSRNRDWDSSVVVSGYWILPSLPSNAEELVLLASNGSNYRWIWYPPKNNSTVMTNADDYYSMIMSQNLSYCYPSYSNTKLLNRKLSKVYFLGESHLRYIYDYLIHEAYPSFMNSLNWKIVKHVLCENIQYDHKVFAIQPGTFIDNIIDSQILKNCNKDNNGKEEEQVITFIIQTGTWDISFWWSPQPTIENPMSSAFLFRIIQYLFTNKCSYKFQLIWLDVHPYPRCYQRDRSDETLQNLKVCYEKQNRNNYALNVLTEHYDHLLYSFFQKGLLTKDNFRIVKTPTDLLYPRLLIAKYVCDNHYLCPKNLEDRADEGILQAKSVQIAACQLMGV